MRMLQWSELIGDGVCDSRTRQSTTQSVQLHIGRRACAEGIRTVWCPKMATGSCVTAANLLIDSLRAAVDSATRLQSVIALVHRHKHGRTDPVTLTFSKNRGRLIAGDEWRTSTALGFVSLYHYAVTVDLPQRMTHWMEFIP